MLDTNTILVDEEYKSLILAHSWYLHGKGQYVTAKINGKHIALHQLIFGEAITVDHINRNKLDNRKENLREATQAQQVINRGLFKSSKTGLKGVHFHKQSNKYRAKITTDGRSIHLGSFNSPEEAALAYDNAVDKYHGIFGVKNGDKETTATRASSETHR